MPSPLTSFRPLTAGPSCVRSRMSVFLKSIEAAHSAEGQGFAGGPGYKMWWGVATDLVLQSVAMREQSRVRWAQWQERGQQPTCCCSILP